MNGPQPSSYDYTGNAFAHTLQVDMFQVQPSLAIVNWDGLPQEMSRSVTDAINLIQGKQMENVADATGKKTSAEWLDLIKKWRQQAGIE